LGGGAGLEEAGRFISFMLGKAGLPALNILLKILNEKRRKTHLASMMMAIGDVYEALFLKWSSKKISSAESVS